MMIKKIKGNHELYKSHYFAGDELYCPFCAKFFRMDTFGKSGGKSTHCPICASSKEERTLLLFLQSRTQLLTGKLNILIISEKNEITEYFKNFPNTEVKIFNPRGDFSIKDGNLKDKYPEDRFDIIICNYILEKLQDYFAVMNEMKRIIKSDGFMILQANIDESREVTLETHHQFYKDRLKIYGILGNYRRFGKDYVQVLNENGLSVFEYDFKLGLENIPKETLYDKYKFYLGYKDHSPVIKNYDSIVDEAIDEHFRVIEKRSIYSLIYILFFLLPDTLKKKIRKLTQGLSEDQTNKSRLNYMIYIQIIGLLLYWVSFALFIVPQFSNSYILALLGWVIGLPIYIICGFGGMAILAGYAYTNDEAGLVKKAIAQVIFHINFFLTIFWLFIPMLLSL